ncbi:MAG: tRNA (guanosine(46)-N7)-methyltransferase TrmB [Chloroflexota bacterium]
MSNDHTINLTYHSTSFSQGKMDFTWEELTDEERSRAYADWEMGKGLIGGDPRKIPNSDRLPDWGVGHPFVRALALGDKRSAAVDDLQRVLSSDVPIEIEIGFGRGDFLLDRAERYPARNFLGYEVKTKATRLCLQRVAKMGLSNLWISDDDVRFSLPRLIPDDRLSMVHVLFPDPWWKDQHRVKRLFSPPFVDLLAEKLASNGLLYFKSDVQEYGELVRYLLSHHRAFADHDPNLAAQIGDFAPTHREFWCHAHDKPFYAYYFQKK